VLIAQAVFLLECGHPDRQVTDVTDHPNHASADRDLYHTSSCTKDWCAARQSPKMPYRWFSLH